MLSVTFLLFFLSLTSSQAGSEASEVVAGVDGGVKAALAGGGSVWGWTPVATEKE